MKGKIHHFSRYAVVVFCTILFQSYNAQKAAPDDAIDVANYRGHKIIIGTEGGIANIRDETVILNSGQVYSHNSVKSEYKYLKTLSGKQTHRVFSLFRGAAVTSFNHPGSMSSFIEIYFHRKVTNYYIWGEAGVAVPDDILMNYTEILKIVR